ncbi:serine protease inhibitor Kazal-type 10-like [Cricetulus griseus]|uniref:Serine protease inhibitor Kazal-type 10-like n=1 Tax=Cricetulus griseus TaxID=10029 RepID=A0A9J7GRG2_CRIGR|nr:serine protease inhibitor Kazal-type 10-like [Cricetulus griseus]
MSQKSMCSKYSSKGHCTREYHAVCGSDGKTYANKCTFYKVVVPLNFYIVVNAEFLMQLHIPMDLIKPCSAYNPLGYCTREYEPVCGTDGITYTNKCIFCLAHKSSRASINLKHYG